MRRTQSRRKEIFAQTADAPEESFDPEQLADERQALDLLGRILNSLDDDLREVFVLYEVEELTMAVIAEMLRLRQGTVASRLRRAREQFQSRTKRLRPREAPAP